LLRGELGCACAGGVAPPLSRYVDMDRRDGNVRVVPKADACTAARKTRHGSCLIGT